MFVVGFFYFVIKLKAPTEVELTIFDCYISKERSNFNFFMTLCFLWLWWN